MAFKAESDDPRFSLSYKLKKILMFRAKAVLTTDPYVKEDPELLALEEVVSQKRRPDSLRSAQRLSESEPGSQDRRRRLELLGTGSLFCRASRRRWLCLAKGGTCFEPGISSSGHHNSGRKKRAARRRGR